VSFSLVCLELTPFSSEDEIHAAIAMLGELILKSPKDKGLTSALIDAQSLLNCVKASLEKRA